MTGRSLALALALALGASAAPRGPAPAADSPVDFRLTDQFGTVHEAARYRGRPLLLVGAGRAGRAAGTAWVGTLRELQGDSADARGGAIPVVAVADLRGVPRLLRRMVRGRFPDDRRQAVLLDWDGTLARGLGLDAERCTILLVGPQGVVQARTTALAVDSAAARTLLRQAAALDATTLPPPTD